MKRYQNQKLNEMICNQCAACRVELTYPPTLRRQRIPVWYSHQFVITLAKTISQPTKAI